MNVIQKLSHQYRERGRLVRNKYRGLDARRYLKNPINSQLKDIPHYLQIPDSEEETKQLVKLYKGHLNEIQENLQRRIQENFDCIDAKYKRRV